MEPTNPFPPTSGVVPLFINALWVDTNVLYAFSGDNVYEYDHSVGAWTDDGLAPCAPDPAPPTTTTTVAPAFPPPPDPMNMDG